MSRSTIHNSPPPISATQTHGLDPVTRRRLVMLFRIHERVCGCDFSDQDACTFNPNDIVCAGCQERICCAIPAARARRGPSGAP